MAINKVTALAAVAGLWMGGSASLAQTTAEAFDADKLIMELQALTRAGQGGGGSVSFAGLPTGTLTAPGTLSATISGSYGPLRGIPGRPKSTRFDASTSLAVGFGDPVNALGFEVGLVNLSFRNFGHSGYLQFGLNRQFSAGQSIVSTALRVTDIAGWGDAKNNKVAGSLITSISYGIQTKNGTMPAMAVIGVGSNVRTNGKAGVILGFGVGVSQDWSVNAGISGDTGVLGASFSPSAWNGFNASFAVRKPRSQSASFGVDLGYNIRLFGG